MLGIPVIIEVGHLNQKVRGGTKMQKDLTLASLVDIAISLATPEEAQKMFPRHTCPWFICEPHPMLCIQCKLYTEV